MRIGIVPLDDYCGESPTFVKLDVEGGEAGALRGAQKLLRTCRPRLFIEVHTQMIGDFGHTLRDLFEAIPGDCYDVTYKIEGTHADWKPYAPGIETGVTAPMLVLATPKPVKSTAKGKTKAPPARATSPPASRRP